MSNIEKFDPSKLMDGVRDRIKATFVSLIPDDKWQELISAEVKKYFNEKKTYRDNQNGLTIFEQDCNSVLREILTEKIKEFIVKYESTFWDGTGPKPSEELINLLKQNASEIFTNTLVGMFQRAVNGLRYN